MSYLRCTARRCSNNQNDLCIREGIQVGGSSAECRSETQCSSFTQREDNYSNVVSRHTEATPETRVSCDACGCTYNQDKHCSAPSVDISGASACSCGETQCSTFDCRENC